MSDAPHKYKMTLSLSVLEHLGVNLYSSVPAVISETVANAWDADANRVSIDIREEGGNTVIVITDNGCGMTVDDINKKFLTVGYHRRNEDSEGKTPGGRIPMGRKGIGKLSLFSIADDIRVYSRKDGQHNAFLLDGAKIREEIQDNKSDNYHPESIPFDEGFPPGDGTRIVIRNLKKRVTRMTSKSLRKRLARRFGIRCTRELSIVLLNNGEADKGGGKISVADRDYFDKLEHMFQYGENYAEFCPQLAKTAVEDRPPSFGDIKEYRISGWIGLVPKSTALSSDGENINKVSVMVREKLAQEDIMATFGFSSMFTRYVIGEIYADFLDQDDQDDIATSSRQSIIEDDPRYMALHKFMGEELKHVRDERDKVMREKAESNAIELIPALREWFDQMKPDTRMAARDFFGRINQINIDPEQKKPLFVHAVSAFIDYQFRNNLNALKKISEEFSEEKMRGFLEVAGDLDRLESVHYNGIVSERLQVIDLLEKAIDKNSLEKEVQDFLFQHLWLLDPSWERGSEVKEKAVSNMFDKYKAEDEKAGLSRIDIKFRQTVGVYVIVELKRPGTSVSIDALRAQVRKYRSAAEDHAQNEAGTERQPDPVEIVCVLGSDPREWKNRPRDRQRDILSLQAENIRIRTYRELIKNARRMYKEYLDNVPEADAEVLKAIRRITQTEPGGK